MVTVYKIGNGPVWQRRHAEDTGRFAPGSSYDNNRFGLVLHLDGRIMGFDINLAPNTSFETAQAAAMEQLPNDIKVVWSKKLEECRVFQPRSFTILMAE